MDEAPWGYTRVKAQRQLTILEILQHERTVEIARLSQDLSASRVTIRRDLLELEHQGLVRATRGGAILNESATYEPAYLAKMGHAKDEKVRIARAAAAMVLPGDTLLLDAGTTTAALAEALAHTRDITVISNSLTIANILTRNRAARFIMIGGTYRELSQAFFGPKAEEALRSIRVDRAFIGTEGMEPERGLEVPDEGDASLKRAMIHCAREVAVVADHTKFALVRLHTFATWSMVGRLITGCEASPEIIRRIQDAGVDVVLA